jgi:hypothetical protein
MLLDKVNERFPDLPVMMMTAMLPAWAYSPAMRFHTASVDLCPSGFP